MKRFIFILFFISFFSTIRAQTETIHVFVALCDNINQGIVLVPHSLGNGQDPRSNLYWGAAYGIKSFFKNKAKDWELVKTLQAENSNILESVLFKHKTKDVYMIADAYDGKKIKNCIEDFLLASNSQNTKKIAIDKEELCFGGDANLVAYIGHDGLMEFDVDVSYKNESENKKDAIILACYSKDFFKSELLKSNAKPLLWTTHLMAPEAYTLKAAIDGWLNRESDLEIEERAAQAYNNYQKCGIKGARNLFTTGF